MSDALSLLAAAAEVRDAPALIADGTLHSYAALAPRVRAAAHAIEAARGGRPVAVVADRRVEVAIALYALLELGVPAALIHPRLTRGERAPLVAGRYLLDEAWRAPPGDAPTPLRADDARAFVLFTSGTTGSPKGVVLTRANLLASAAASAAHLGWRPGDRWLAPIPLAHVGGLSVLTRCLIARACAVVGEPASLADDVARHGATLVSVVPALLPRLTAPAALRAVLVGGAAAPPRLLAEAWARGIPALATYGMTEACSQIATEALESPGEGLIPMAGMQVSVRGGRICVRGPAVSPGYLGAPARGEHDWLDTGDLGALDRAGRLHVIGRADDLIVTGGENVHPAEIERALAARDDVAESCAFGVPDELWGAIVAVAIVPRGALDDRALAAHLAATLASHKRPRRLAVVDALPRTPGGKLDRAAAARLIAPWIRAMPRP